MLRVARQYPALRALCAQLGATLLVGLALYLAAQAAPWRPTWLAAGLAQGLLAGGLARYLGLSRWWCWLNLLFVPALLLASGAPLPSWVFLCGFVLVLLLNWNSFGEQVPLYLTGGGARKQLVILLEQQPNSFRFIDLGCGPGGTLLSLARQFPRSQFVGVETAPLSFLIAWLRALNRPNCEIRYESLWRTDLGAFDVVYCFLSPAPMLELWAKTCAQMPIGSLLISNTFEIPGQQADQQVELHDWRQSRLLLWRMRG
ncbi:Putative methyltransferase [Pseudomonas guineae]|uniref:Methyltransferase n=1 Tax=Pseudomonas guineae TaxID=425504 RepID=A0A1I3EKU2_9PSED|nr:class I SAM-dependent methyltransferase [Pseudomonas guineae]SFH99430.1 Putative methyltransferase [Pseudomonas guineae]